MSIALILPVLALACGDVAGPAFSMDFTTRSNPNTYTSSDTGLTWTQCDMDLTIAASGGAADDVAVFEGGSWSNGSCRQCSGDVPVDWFVDVFGVDRARSGESIRGGFYSRRLADSGFDFRLTLRFRMPTGELRAHDVRFACQT